MVLQRTCAQEYLSIWNCMTRIEKYSKNALMIIKHCNKNIATWLYLSRKFLRYKNACVKYIQMSEKITHENYSNIF